MNKSELWKDVIGYEGKYKISNYGKVKSLDRIIKNKNNIIRKLKGKILKNQLDTHGYNIVFFGRRKSKYIHILVAESFIGKRTKTCIDHIDGNKLNNYYKNLEYVSKKENNIRAKNLGIMAIGSRKNQSKLNEKDVYNIKLLIKKGIPYKKILTQYNTSISALSFIKNNKTWTHVRI